MPVDDPNRNPGHYAEIEVHWTGQCEARLNGVLLGQFGSEHDARVAILAKMRTLGWTPKNGDASYLDVRA